jgi:two-component system, OmpR family, response regulator TctD
MIARRHVGAICTVKRFQTEGERGPPARSRTAAFGILPAYLALSAQRFRLQARSDSCHSADLVGGPLDPIHMRILLVEDTEDVGEAIVQRLTRTGHAVDWEVNGDAGMTLARDASYDLVILDVMLPGADGFAILEGMRARGLMTPVLILTARSRVEDRVDALDIGADDYLVKPFDFRELEARVRALIRRKGGEATNILRCGDIRLDRSTRMVRVKDREVHLKRREMTLLEIFLARPGRVFGKDELLDRMSGYDDAPSTNAIELYIGRLRRKIEGGGARIVTVRGYGYQMVTNDEK